MAGKVVVSTLNDDAGVLATQNGMTGIPKAWVNFDGTANPGTIRGSFNVSSVTYTTTGDYTVNFTTAMPNANYAAVMSVGTFANTDGTNRSIVSRHQQTTSVRLMIYVSTNANPDTSPSVNVSVFSS